MLRCADGSYYVGITRDILTRMRQHHEGKGAEYTKRRFEKRVQGWGRAKREALINGDLHLLPELAKKNFHREP